MSSQMPHGSIISSPSQNIESIPKWLVETPCKDLSYPYDLLKIHYSGAQRHRALIQSLPDGCGDNRICDVYRSLERTLFELYFIVCGADAGARSIRENIKRDVREILDLCASKESRTYGLCQTPYAGSKFNDLGNPEDLLKLSIVVEERIRQMIDTLPSDSDGKIFNLRGELGYLLSNVYGIQSKRDAQKIHNDIILTVKQSLDLCDSKSSWKPSQQSRGMMELNAKYEELRHPYTLLKLYNSQSQYLYQKIKSYLSKCPEHDFEELHQHLAHLLLDLYCVKGGNDAAAWNRREIIIQDVRYSLDMLTSKFSIDNYQYKQLPKWLRDRKYQNLPFLGDILKAYYLQSQWLRRKILAHTSGNQNNEFHKLHHRLKRLLTNLYCIRGNISPDATNIRDEIIQVARDSFDLWNYDFDVQNEMQARPNVSPGANPPPSDLHPDSHERTKEKNAMQVGPDVSSGANHPLSDLHPDSHERTKEKLSANVVSKVDAQADGAELPIPASPIRGTDENVEDQEQPREQQRQQPHPDELIIKYKEELQPLREKVEEFSSGRKDDDYYDIEEALDGLLIKLDRIDFRGDQDIRNRRREVILAVLKEIELLEAKVPSTGKEFEQTPTDFTVAPDLFDRPEK